MGKYRKLTEHRTPAWYVVAPVVKNTLLLLTKPKWTGGENIPTHGGAILVPNHVSHIDPLTVCHMVWDYGRLPHFLAKASLFKGKFMHAVMAGTGQVPVQRGGIEAADSLSAAVEAIKNGAVIIVPIEGSITKDPDGWPMRGKSGAARLALLTGAPVIPIGQWGAQKLLPPYGKPNLKGGRKTVEMKIGEPVDLSDLRAQPQGAHGYSPDVIRQATDRILAKVVELVEDVRGEKAPAERFDPAKHGISETGNPNAKG